MMRLSLIRACGLVLALGALAFFLGVPASALTFRIDFVELLGTYDVLGEGPSSVVDSGVTTPFRVDHVAMEVDAISACGGDPACDPDSGYRAITAFIIGGEWHFNSESSVRVERAIPNPVAFDDSRFGMRIGLGNICVDGYPYCESAPITVTNAALIVTGETVPEPCSGAMVVLGLVILSARKARRAA
jgi:hypothetical protein